MNVLCMIGLATTLIAEPTNKTFANYEFGLTFQYPSTWQVSTNKTSTKFLIPLEGAATAELNIYSATFNRDIETWQYVQKDIVLQMKRELIDQSQEEIMGVPLLLTKSRYTVKDVPTIASSGLLYSATLRKMLYRLVASEAVFDSANQAWSGVLQTLRTTSGKGLKTEDPNRKIDPKDIKNVTDKPPTVTVIEGPKNKRNEIKKGEVKIPATAGGQKVNLCMPSGWGGEKQSDGSIVIRHPDLSTTLQVQIFSMLDSDPPAKALFRLSSKSLDDYINVTRREEPKPFDNNAGVKVNMVWRSGKSAKGDLFTCEATGASVDYYWIFTYRTENGSVASSERKLIETLIKTMSVEPGG